ncbi:MAG TPA: hypothetical protein VIV11_00980 [Kofleriaceae bacterium]
MGRFVIALLVTGCGRIAFDPLDDVPLGDFALTSHGTHTCALFETGELYCWGSNMFGQLGEGAGAFEPLPRRIPNVPAFDQIALAEYSTFARSRDGQLWAWGGNADAMLGIGTETDIEPPHAIAIADVEQVAASQYFTCARHGDGTVSCWGDNACGHLGDGTFTNQLVPQRVPNLSGVTSIGVHDIMACALTMTGELYCWGAQLEGACPAPLPTPTLMPLPPIGEVEGGCHITLCAVGLDGAVWCRGENDQGQLGNGTMIESDVFVPVDFGASPPQIIDIAVGSYHVCARTVDHRVWCWGDNLYGSLGIADPATRRSMVPLQVPFFDGSIAIDDFDAGCGQICVRSGRDVFCWGLNGRGQLGDGTLDNQFAPVRIDLNPQ